MALLRVHVERLLDEELRGVALALAEMTERELGERGRVTGLAHEHLASILDRALVLPRVAKRRDEQRARLDRAGVILHEVLEARGGVLVRAATTPHLGERDGDLLALRGDLRGRAELLLGVREIARVGEHDAEIEARLPEVGIDRDRLAEERDGARLHARILRGSDALDHALHGDRVRGRQALLGDLRAWPAAAAAARDGRERDSERGDAYEGSEPRHFAPFFFGGGFLGSLGTGALSAAAVAASSSGTSAPLPLPRPASPQACRARLRRRGLGLGGRRARRGFVVGARGGGLAARGRLLLLRPSRARPSRRRAAANR